MAVYSRLIKVRSPLMRGEDVRAVQNRLNSLGYNAGTADGYYGDNTKNGVKRFQSARGLSADGIVGPDTWNKLFSSNSSGGSSTSSNYSNNLEYHRLIKVSSPLMRGADVKSVQIRLNSLGYNAGTADGYYGDNTRNGVKRFQSARGLSADGIVGPATWEKLMSGCKYLDITNTLISICKKYERDYKNKYSRLNTPQKLYVFYNLVRNHGECDLKNQGFDKSKYTFNGRVIRGDGPGNILYGYLGKSFGFPDQLLLRAAGYAQYKAGSGCSKWGHWYGSAPYGDDPSDQDYIKQGISYYRQTH